MFLVAGLGKTGLSVARYLTKRSKPFCLFDTRSEPPDIDDIRNQYPEINIFLGLFPSHVLCQIEGVICSPGVPLEGPVFEDVKARNIPIWGDIECLASELRADVIAVTGTNGKSTVTTLVGEMAKAGGLSTAVAGNIGTPVLDILDDGCGYELWVLELSSFQLELTHSLASLASSILNVTPDHLDRHHTFDAYLKAKQRVYSHAAFTIYNRDDRHTFPCNADEQTNATVISYGLSQPMEGEWGIITENGMTYLAYGSERILPVDRLRLKGTHHWANALAACALASTKGIDMTTMVSVLEQFPGLPHRTQWVRTFNGVDWINDSKGTNVGATVAAINGLGEAAFGKLVLIAGGQGKNADFSVLREPVSTYVHTLILIGEDAPNIAAVLEGLVSIEYAASMEHAVMLSKAAASSGDIVLLSPACASFDMFNDFNHRGEVFMTAVNSF